MRIHTPLWLLAGAVLILILTGLEVAARVVKTTPEGPAATVEFNSPGRHETILARENATLGWSFAPGELLSTLGERANSAGFRGAEPESRPVNRILCLGSSNTFGLGVPGEEAYPARLHRWTRNATGEAWEVWNAGVPRFSAVQMLALFRSQLAAVKPKIVVVLPRGWDHVSPAVVKSDDACLGVLDTRHRTAGAGFFEPRLTRWFGIGASSRSSFEARPSTPELVELWRSLRQRPNGPRVSPTEFQRTMRTLCDEIRAAGAVMVLVNSPSRAVAIRGFPELAVYTGILDNVASEKGIPIVHAREEFYAESEADPKHFFDDFNLTAEAHARLATSISWCLANLGVPSLPKFATSAEPTYRLDLRPILGKAILTAREGAEPFNVGAFDRPEVESVVMPNAATLSFENLTIPRDGLLRFRLALLEPASAPTESMPVNAPMRASISIRSEGCEARRVFVEEIKRTDWRQWLDMGDRTIDLHEFGGKTVTLDFETLGSVHFVNWGKPSLVSFENPPLPAK